MIKAAELETKLLEKGHKLPIVVQGDLATIEVSKSSFNLSGLKSELSNLAQTVEGISEVAFKEVKTYEASVYRRQKFELPSKVLFVDDEKDFVHAISERLISRDVGTYGVYGGEEALEIVASDCPDVMVLDLKMPGMHGTEVLEKVKNEASEIEVIILTGHGNAEDEQTCMSLGAFAYLNKPVDIEELSETIKAANEKAQKNKNTITTKTA